MTHHPLFDNDLWKKIQDFPLDEISATMPFSQRLARDHLWTHEYALEVIEEYKKFIYLCATGNTMATPSEDVDEAWHLHMVYTRSYWNELCAKVLGKDLHHGPTPGGEESTKTYKDAYEQTLKRYIENFGPIKNPLIWPSPKKRFANRKGAGYITISTADFGIIPTPKVKLIFPIMLTLGLIGIGIYFQKPLDYWMALGLASLGMIALGAHMIGSLNPPGKGDNINSAKYNTTLKSDSSGGGCGSTAAGIMAADSGGGCGGCGGD